MPASALPAGDPLVARTTVRLSDLAGRQLPDGSPADKGEMAAGSRRALDLSQIFNLVEVGTVVWLLPDWVAGASRGRTSPIDSSRTWSR